MFRPSGLYRLTTSYEPLLFWHDMSESRKIRFAMMKLTGQDGQYWEKLERMMGYRRKDPVETWESIKKSLC